MSAFVIAAFLLAGLGLWITGINFYLSFVRYGVHRLLHRDKPYKWVSGFPIIGSLFLWLASVLLWWLGLRYWAITALIVSFLDTGGLIWFLSTMAWETFRGKSTPE
jgi:hypothetical protein